MSPPRSAIQHANEFEFRTPPLNEIAAERSMSRRSVFFIEMTVLRFVA